MTTRRSFLELAGCLAAGPQVSALAEPDLITSIEQTIIWSGRQAGVVWFHPRACRVPAKPHPILLMTVQSISGSDVFGPVHWSKSTDAGRSWSAPEPIPGMGRRRHPDGIEEGVCDVVPEFHEKTKTVLAMGHNVYYKNQVLTRPSELRWPVYLVPDARGDWSAPRKFEWTHPEATAMYTSGCSQRITLANGGILISLWTSPSWKMQARDAWIGWSDEQRKRNLQWIVNNGRFLILPWVRVKGLASKIMALSALQMPQDGQTRYGNGLLLLETLVDRKRFRGTCYRAANWLHVGRTAGRGRMDREHQRHGQAIKDIYVYPLARDARQRLCGDPTQQGAWR